MFLSVSALPCPAQPCLFKDYYLSLLLVCVFLYPPRVWTMTCRWLTSTFLLNCSGRRLQLLIKLCLLLCHSFIYFFHLILHPHIMAHSRLCTGVRKINADVLIIHHLRLEHQSHTLHCLASQKCNGQKKNSSDTLL